MMTTLKYFDGAIVDDTGIIVDVLSFSDLKDIDAFQAKLLFTPQRIGDKYLTEDDLRNARLKSMIDETINAI